MSYTQDIHEVDVYTALRAFIMDTLGDAVTAVVRLPNNRVPMPDTMPFITMSPVLKEQLARPWQFASDPATQPQTQTTEMPTRYQIQVDAYGPGSGDLIQILAAVIASPDAFAFFAENTTPGTYPLYADAPRQHPLVDGEAQYEERWSMDFSLEYNPTLSAVVQTASTVTAGVINVEATYN